LCTHGPSPWPRRHERCMFDPARPARGRTPTATPQGPYAGTGLRTALRPVPPIPAQPRAGIRCIPLPASSRPAQRFISSLLPTAHVQMLGVALRCCCLSSASAAASTSAAGALRQRRMQHLQQAGGLYSDRRQRFRSQPVHVQPPPAFFHAHQRGPSPAPGPTAVARQHRAGGAEPAAGAGRRGQVGGVQQAAVRGGEHHERRRGTAIRHGNGRQGRRRIRRLLQHQSSRPARGAAVGLPAPEFLACNRQPHDGR
jgi:hypothetical protein